MNSLRFDAGAVLTIVVAAACGVLTVLWPDWRAALQAKTYYQQGPRMTGGGSVFGGSRITHGFELHCDPAEGPNRLEVSWGKGNTFHLETLTHAACSNDPAIELNPPSAGFDTYQGAGAGRYNGVDGALAEWTFTDAGEPGTGDFAEIVIMDAEGNVLAASGLLRKGNHQAHGR